MMQRLIPWIMCGFVTLLPAFASAQQAPKIRNIDTQVSDDDVLIELVSSAPIEKPEVTIALGRLSLVLRAGLREMRSMGRDGDGEFVRLVQLRPRSSSSSTAYILFRDDAVLTPASAIDVDVLGNSVVIRIAKSGFVHAPPPAPVAQEASAVAQATTEAQPAATAPAEIAPTAATATTATTAATATTTTAAATTTAAPATATTPADSAPATPAATPAREARARAFSAAIPAAAGPSAPVILFLTALLAGTYFALRHLLARRQKKEAPAIQVIAAKRLGARHQLMIVRAFGRDHFLSVQGTTTTRIASMKAGASMTLDAESLAKESPEERAERLSDLEDDDGLSLADLKIGRAEPKKSAEPVIRLARSYPPAAQKSDSIPVGPKSELRKKLQLDEETRFGAELLKMVKESMPPRSMPAPAPLKAESSVAGIARLRRQAVR